MPTAIRAPLSWLTDKGNRLDAGYYAGEGQKRAREFVHSAMAKEPLSTLCQNGEEGVFYGGRFKRTYVSDKAKGLALVTGSSIVRSEPTHSCRYASKLYTPDICRLTLREGMTVITRSGSIGNLVFVGAALDGVLGSDDLIRVVPDAQKVLPGYLYAFLSSSIGKALVTQHTYGSVIQHIEPHHLYELPVPMLDTSRMEKIASHVENAASLRAEALELIHSTRSQVQMEIHKIFDQKLRSRPLVARCSSKNISVFEHRLDAPTSCALGKDIYDAFTEVEHSLLGEIAPSMSVYLFGKKNLKSGSNQGFPLYKSSSMIRTVPESDFILAAAKESSFRKLKVKSGWILVSRSGTVGRIVRVLSSWDGHHVDDHMIRLRPKKGLDGFIYAFLSCQEGNELIQFQKYGSVQDQIGAQELNRIPIPKQLLKDSLVARMQEHISSAFAKFDRALKAEEDAILGMESELDRLLQRSRK